MGLQNKYMGRLHINVGAQILTGVRQLRKYVVHCESLYLW